MTLLDPDDQPAPGAGAGRRVAFLGGAVVVTALLVVLALLLGAWGFDFRRYSQHSARLQRLQGHEPTLEQVVGGLEDEGSPLVAAPETEAELRAEAERRGGARASEVLEKGRRFPHTRVFLAGDMVYFIYFDAAGIMRDFTCVSR